MAFVIVISLIFLVPLSFIQSERNLLPLQSLEMGPCREEGDAFCLSRVVNSICAVEKDECFCKPGFVSVQEGHRISCKSLLTNLKCHVDGDCVHVDGSACHPGAGYCSCPAGTVFVAEEHACRALVDDDSNAVCTQCKQDDGVCYRFVPNQRLSETAKEYYAHTWNLFVNESRAPKSTYRCSCSNQRASTRPTVSYPIELIVPPSGPGSSTIQSQPNSVILDPTLNQNETLRGQFCTAHLVDIGSYCNEIDLICRPRNGFCSLGSLTNGSFPMCLCHLGYVPVYQYHLGYHECFPQLQTRDEYCDECSRIGGLCYSMNPSKSSATGCLCASGQTHQWSNRRRGKTLRDGSLCDEILEVHCTETNLTICHKRSSLDHREPLAEGFQENRAILLLSGSHSGGETCPMHFQRNVSFQDRHRPDSSIAGDDNWCRTINYIENGVPRCGFDISGEKRQTFIHGLATLIVDPTLRSMLSPRQFRFACTVADETAESESQKAVLSVLSSTYPALTQSQWWNWSKKGRLVQFSIRDNGGDVTTGTITKGSPLQLFARLLDSQYTSIGVEQCSVSQETHGKPLGPMVIVYKGYPTVESGLKIDFQTRLFQHHSTPMEENNLGMKSISSKMNIISSLFPSFILLRSRRGGGMNHDSTARNGSKSTSYERAEKEEKKKKDRVIHRGMGEIEVDATPFRLRSSEAHPFVTIKHQVRFACVFQLHVQEQIACSQSTYCGQQSGRNIRPVDTTMRLAYETLNITVLEYLQDTWGESARKAEMHKSCTGPFCIDRFQILIILVTSSLILGLVIILILIWRLAPSIRTCPRNCFARKRTVKSIEPFPSPTPSGMVCNNLMEASNRRHTPIFKGSFPHQDVLVDHSLYTNTPHLSSTEHDSPYLQLNPLHFTTNAEKLNNHLVHTMLTGEPRSMETYPRRFDANSVLITPNKGIGITSESLRPHYATINPYCIPLITVPDVDDHIGDRWYEGEVETFQMNNNEPPTTALQCGGTPHCHHSEVYVQYSMLRNDNSMEET